MANRKIDKIVITKSEYNELMDELEKETGVECRTHKMTPFTFCGIYIEIEDK